MGAGGIEDRGMSKVEVEALLERLLGEHSEKGLK